MNRWVLAAVLTLAGMTTAVASAQQVEITAPAPRSERGGEGIIGPNLQYEMTQPDDMRYLPPNPRVHHEPAFIGPLSAPTETPTSTGRIGVAGWTSPSAAMGGIVNGSREVTGYFAIGFAVEWGGPPPAKRPAR